ncbi:hypothetical protein [Actinoplanes subglobosus]|uniref:Uncharacterized protein n=1 Tax=Actinoplanes subglobosus TaxID=1547892 RepID=A0ABV8IYI7_9ACTN
MTFDTSDEALRAERDRDDVSYVALLTRPHEAYNPHHLVRDVMALLMEKGLHPDLPAGSVPRRALAEVAATDLLRSFGILPAGGVDVIDRRNAPDPHER